jgi:hypothetical protein
MKLFVQWKFVLEKNQKKVCVKNVLAYKILHEIVTPPHPHKRVVQFCNATPLLPDTIIV